MRLVRPSLAEVDPFLNGLLFLPSIVACQSFHAWQVRATVEDLILLLEDLQSLLCCLVLVGGSLDLLEEGLLTDDIFVLFNNICMSCRQALHGLQVLLVSCVMDPGVNNFDLLWLKRFLLFCGEEGSLHVLVAGVTARPGGHLRCINLAIAAEHTTRLVLLRRYLTLFVGRFRSTTLAAHHGFIYLVDRELFHLLPCL